MTDARPTSFPFLAIAKEFGVPYSDVIRAAHVLNPNSFFRFPTVCGVFVPQEVERAIILALERERDRRAGFPEVA